VSRARGPRWAAVRALVTDVDGVVTDGGLYYAENGDELKRFDSQRRPGPGPAARGRRAHGDRVPASRPRSSPAARASSGSPWSTST
jgi:hypothetical protein